MNIACGLLFDLLPQYHAGFSAPVPDNEINEFSASRSTPIQTHRFFLSNVTVNFVHLDDLGRTRTTDRF
jgi:hypothetical protein